MARRQTIAESLGSPAEHLILPRDTLRLGSALNADHLLGMRSCFGRSGGRV